jgi:hypothetical protein
MTTETEIHQGASEEAEGIKAGEDIATTGPQGAREDEAAGVDEPDVDETDDVEIDEDTPEDA